jgi:hypothetical protein
MTAALDHLVWAVPDLAAGVAAFASRTGVEPAPGGRHEGLGTANWLVGLTGPIGDGAYLEIIGPTEDEPTAAPARPFGIDELSAPRLAAWAVRTDDLDGFAAAAAAAGVDVGEVRSMSRATPGGEVLTWRLTVPARPVEGGVVPFGIDWGSTAHPTSRGLPSVELRGWRASHQDPDRVATVLGAMGASLEVTRGDAGLVAELRGAGGSIRLA